MKKIQIWDHGIQDEKNLDPVSWIWDGKHSDSGFRIRDKHPISKTGNFVAKFART